MSQVAQLLHESEPAGAVLRQGENICTYEYFSRPIDSGVWNGVPLLASHSEGISCQFPCRLNMYFDGVYFACG